MRTITIYIGFSDQNDFVFKRQSIIQIIKNNICGKESFDLFL